jgi:hypothetical protein
MNVVGNVDTTPSNHKAHRTHAPSSDKWKMFDVPTDVFRRFENGKQKFSRWSKYLSTEDSNQSSILDYAKRRPKNTIVLRDSVSGALRQIRRNSHGLG